MPGGVVVNPPEPVRAAVARQIPALPLEHFDRIGAMYHVERGYQAQPLGEVRNALQAVGEKAAALWIELGELSEEAQNVLWQGCYARGRPELKAEAEHALRMLAGVARNAASDIGAPGAGAPRGARHIMVVRLANLLKEFGIDPDARPTGELVFLTSSILDAYGEQVKHVDKLVAAALKTIPSK